MFDVYDTLTGILQVATGVMSTLKVCLIISSDFIRMGLPKNCAQGISP